MAMSFSLSVNKSTSTTRFIDLTTLPVTQVDKGSKPLALFLMIFACCWGGIPTTVLLRNLLLGTVPPDQWGILIFTVIGAALFFGGIYLLTKQTTLTLSLEQVDMTKKTLFGTTQWTERLTAYEGIRARSEYHSGSKNSPSYTLYIIELLHTDSARTIRLYEARNDLGFRKIWEDACRTLNLPAVEGEGTTLFKRAPEDLDKSVKDLVREGKMQVNFDPAKPPPKGLSLKADGRILEVSVHKDKAKLLVGFLIAFGVTGIFIYLGFFEKSAPLAFGIVGIIAFLVIAAAAFWSFVTEEQIRVGQDEIHIRHVTPWGHTAGNRLDPKLVEVVRIGQKNGQGSKGILLETDDTTTAFGQGLSSESLEWLKNCILKVITT